MALSAALAVFTAVCFGVQVLLVEYSMDRNARLVGARPALAAAFLTLVTSVGVLWSLVFIRRDGALPPLELLLPFVLAGVLDPALTRAFYYESIDRIGPSVSSAITAGSPAVATAVAIPALGERVTVWTGVGLACVVGGIAGLQLTKGEADADSTDILKRELAGVTARDLALPLAAMVAIGVAFVVVKIGLQSYPDSLVATATTQTGAFLAFLVLFSASPDARGRAVDTEKVALAVLLLTGLIVAVGWYTMFHALQLGSVVTVLPLVSTYPLVVVVLTSILARDLPRSPRVVGSILLIVVGAGLVQVS